MNLSTVLIKVVGAVFLAWTVRSIVMHLKSRKDKKPDDQSNSERVLNGFIYYLWIAFMAAFSIGMIVNN